MRTFLVVLAVTGFALGALPGTARAESPDAAILRLSDAYLEQWLIRHPARATAIGARRFDDMLVPVTEASLLEDATWESALRAQADSVAPGALSPDRRADRDLLLAALERDLVTLEVRRPWRHDPSSALPLVRDAIVALADPARGPSCRRLQMLVRRLAQVPEALRAARVLLTEPDSAAVDAAIPAFDETARLYRTTVGASIADCADANRQAQFAEADSAAVRAVSDFARALREELLPRAGHVAPLGSEATARWLASEGVLDGTPQAMLGRAETEARAPRPAGEDDSKRRDLADSTAAFEWLRASIDAAPGAFTARGRAVTVSLDRVRPRVVVRREQAPATTPELRLSGPGAFEPAGRGWNIDVLLALPARFDEHEVAGALDRALVDLARETARRDLPSLLREAVTWSATADGIRSDLARATPVASDAADAGTMLRAMLGGGAPGLAHVAPERGLAALGRWRLEALRDAARAALGARYDARKFDDAVIAAGDAPWPQVREQVLARLSAPR